MMPIRKRRRRRTSPPPLRTGAALFSFLLAAALCDLSPEHSPSGVAVVSAFRIGGSLSSPAVSSRSRPAAAAAIAGTATSGCLCGRPTTTALHGWLDKFLPPPYDPEAEAAAEAARRRDYPEQYPATYELLPSLLPSDDGSAAVVRPLLRSTQLERRPLRVAYDAAADGWDARSFHAKVDGLGAAVVLATTEEAGGTMVGGYNPKGWAGLGGARPSVAAFLFYQRRPPSSDGDADDYEWQKLVKVGGGGLACATDNPNEGIYFGPDGLVIPLRSSSGSDADGGAAARRAQSKLGPYFERGPEDRPSLFAGGAAALRNVQVLVGVYGDGEEIPYSGGVMDMTSG
jgi:hypothetical protein